MRQDDLEYIGVCNLCDTETQILVVEEEEPPVYCPMCGHSVTFELLDDDDYD